MRELRRLGLDIRVVSIRRPDRPTGELPAAEREEAGRTFYVKGGGWGRILGDHFTVLLTRPVPYVRGLAYAVKTARMDLRKTVYHVAYFGQAVAVGQWLKREGLTHVHTHFSSTVALFLSVVFPISVSMTIHGSDEFKDSIGFLLPEKIERAAFICAISKYGKGQLARVSPAEHWSRIEVAPLGVDLAQFAPRPFRVSPRPMVITCVGRLASPKSHILLIEAVEWLLQRDRPVVLRLVGDGPDRRMLEQAAARAGVGQYVRFEGALNQDGVVSVYSESDVFALSSFAEGVPVVLMEAMAMEIACVATWVTGIPELIRNEVDGLLVPPADSEALAEALARLYDDAELRERLGKAGRVRVAELYELTANVRRLGRIFESRISPPSGPAK